MRAGGTPAHNKTCVLVGSFGGCRRRTLAAERSAPNPTKKFRKTGAGGVSLGGVLRHPPKGETCDNFGVVGLTAGKNGAIIVQEVGNVEKNDTKVRLSVTLAPKVLEKLDILCREKGVSRPAIVALALDKYWKEEHPDW